MLQSLLPKPSQVLALPLLGSIADGLTIGSRSTDTRPAHASSRFACCHTWMPICAAESGRCPALTHATLHASWRCLIEQFPTNAGTVARWSAT